MDIPYFVAYYRVSTAKQGQSGLGLAAQQTTVAQFAAAAQGKIIAEFTEIESGKTDARAKLLEAIAYAKAHKSRLLIAKLDRLSRNVAFIFTLRDSGVDFQACDVPDANTLNIGIFATIAQHERELISRRTKEALAVKKQQGFTLGKPENLTDEARKKAYQVRRQIAQAQDGNQKAYQISKDLRGQGLSFRRIAEKLNGYGFSGVNGGKYYAVTIQKLLRLYA